MHATYLAAEYGKCAQQAQSTDMQKTIRLELYVIHSGFINSIAFLLIQR